MRPMSRRKLRGLSFFLALGVLFPWSLGLAQETPPIKKDDAPAISKRGPGMKGPATDFLKLPVPRTLDLTHVEPEHFAAALGKDPERIFEFVRDHVAYEPYSGCLRGPRGTLLAMAGNSVDRAALLADLLEKSGRHIRFVHGTLPEADAKDLVTSLWARRPRPAAHAEAKPSPAAKAALDTLMTGVKRDYSLIRDHLKNLEKMPARQPGPSLAELVKEAQPHYWVQWSKDNKWVDLDPSFADSVPGGTHAHAQKQFATLPPELYHQVTIRIQIEEYGIYLQGDAATKPSQREILCYTATAADLSGIDLVLMHQPASWQGPARNLQSAVAAGVKDTGEVKPVLLTGPKKWIAGEAFRHKPSAGGGGGIIAGLTGAGTRKPMAVATAEWIVFEFAYPDAHKESVIRQIFDWTGMARRGGQDYLGAAEIREKTNDEEAMNYARAVFSLFFSTGAIEETHLATLAQPPPEKKARAANARPALRLINCTLAALSDKLLASLDKDDRTIIRFYPDSPRVQLVDLTRSARKQRLTIDLRRDHTRAVAQDDPAATFPARVFHGVVNGTLERVLGEYITTEKSPQRMTPGFSTSSLFDQAFAEGIPTRVLRGDAKGLPETLPKDAQARLRETLANGFLVVVPQQGLKRGKELRLAWWQIDSRSGKTTAVTDEGLYQDTAERTVLVGSEEDGEVTVVVEDYFEGQVDRTWFTIRGGTEALVGLLDHLGDIDSIMFTW